MLKRHSQGLLLAMVMMDIFAAAVAWTAAYGLRYLAGVLDLTQHPMPSLLHVVALGALSLLLIPPIFSLYDLYAIRRTQSLRPELLMVAAAVLTIWGLAYFSSILLTHVVVSRLLMGWLLIGWIVLACAGRMSVRLFLRQLRQRGYNLRHAAIIGTGRLAQRLHHTLLQNPWTGIKVHYFIDDDNGLDQLRGTRVYHATDNANDIVAGLPVDIVFVALAKHQYQKVDQVIGQLSQTSTSIVVVPDLLSNVLLRQRIIEIDDMCIVSLTVSPQNEWPCAIKRAIDVSVSLVALLVLCVPMVVIALIIKLNDSGPIFYRQTRGIFASSPFTMIKFRSMRVGAGQDSEPGVAGEDDPRITRIGRVLRKWSLDELPQLFNVLAGNMSLVGPRPERPEIADRLRSQIPGYLLRTYARPGMTGLAQANGYRGRTSLRKRIQYDLYYVKNWSLSLDFAIMLRTLFGGFLDRSTQ